VRTLNRVAERAIDERFWNFKRCLDLFDAFTSDIYFDEERFCHHVANGQSAVRFALLAEHRQYWRNPANECQFAFGNCDKIVSDAFWNEQFGFDQCWLVIV
jgi:hypothetical protein